MNDIKTAPSGAFQYRIREALRKDEREREGVLRQITHTYIGQQRVVEQQYSSADLEDIEIWTVTEEVLIPNPKTDAKEKWVPLSIGKSPEGRYMKVEFLNWLGEQRMGDTMAMHQTVLEKNLEWMPPGMRRLYDEQQNTSNE